MRETIKDYNSVVNDTLICNQGCSHPNDVSYLWQHRLFIRYNHQSHLYTQELCYYADGDAGMYLLTQRWYSSVLGRFIGKDRLKNELHLYLYVGNNPLLVSDPLGLQHWYCQGPTCWIYQCLGGPPTQRFTDKAWQVFQKCLGNCYLTIFKGSKEFAKCMKNCVGKNIKGELLDLAAQLACFAYHYYAHIPTQHSYINPCLNPYSRSSNPGYSTDACQECCDFPYCKCLITSHPRKWGKCYTEQQKCYLCCP
ncbi:hypothetical protein H5T87_07560 [bacterium]|nr:hypothetical protein [bacterium]